MIYDANMHQIFITVPLLRSSINNEITGENKYTNRLYDARRDQDYRRILDVARRTIIHLESGCLKK